MMMIILAQIMIITVNGIILTKAGSRAMDMIIILIKIRIIIQRATEVVLHRRLPHHHAEEMWSS
jgi:Mn2+/Fe2+ NRAMP family transporter